MTTAAPRRRRKKPPIMPTPNRLIFAVVTGLVPFMLLATWPALLALAVGAGAAGLLLAQAVKLIGGHTGDVLGASEQVFEVAVLLVLAGNWA